MVRVRDVIEHAEREYARLKYGSEDPVSLPSKQVEALAFALVSAFNKELRNYEHVLKAR